MMTWLCQIELCKVNCNRIKLKKVIINTDGQAFMEAFTHDEEARDLRPDRSR